MIYFAKKFFKKIPCLCFDSQEKLVLEKPLGKPTEKKLFLMIAAEEMQTAKELNFINGKNEDNER